MRYTELKQPLPVCIKQGKGLAIHVIDYGPEHHLMWVVVLDDTGEIWTVSNPGVRVRPNPTLGAKRESRERV